MTRTTMMIGLLGLATACGNATGGTGGGGAGGAGVDPCAQAAAHEAECGASPGSGGSSNVPCTGAIACQAACVNAHTCAQINGNDPAYTGCVARCQGK